MRMININREENAERNAKYGYVTVSLNMNELGLIKNALYESIDKSSHSESYSESYSESKKKLLAECNILFDLLSYGGIDRVMIGVIAEELGVCSKEYLEFCEVKRFTDNGTLKSKEHLAEAVQKLKIKEGIE